MTGFFGKSSLSKTNPQDVPELRPINNGHGTLKSYRDRLRSLYTEPLYIRYRFERWQVSEIRTYKDQNSQFKHEYLIATVHDESGLEVLLRIDRRVQDPVAAELNGQSSKKTASDQLHLLQPTTFRDDQLPVGHLTFPDGHHVPLPQFIVLACTVNKCSKTYNALRRNCYWFCHVTTEALRKEFDGEVQSVKGSNQQGWLYFFPLCGDFDIDQVVQKYRNGWNKFLKHIDGVKNNPENKNVIAAKKLAEEERWRAEEERRRAEEERERAEQERRRADNAERELRELKAELQAKYVPRS